MKNQKLLLMIPGRNGDTRLVLHWDSKNPDSVKEMKERFIELKRKGYIFFEAQDCFGDYLPKGMPVKDFMDDAGVLVAQKYFDELEHVDVEEVTTKVSTDGKETRFFDPETEDPKDKATYTAMTLPSGG